MYGYAGCDTLECLCHSKCAAINVRKCLLCHNIFFAHLDHSCAHLDVAADDGDGEEEDADDDDGKKESKLLCVMTSLHICRMNIAFIFMFVESCQFYCTSMFTI